MEESTQRRERLRAMRLEASQVAATNNDDRSTSLSNPLLESTTNQVQSFPQSFNYYTNPMAAYSGNKQIRQVSSQASQNYSSASQWSQTNEALRSPSMQPHMPNPRMQQPQGQYANPNHTSPSWNTNGPPQRAGFPRFSNSSGHGSGRGYHSPGPNFTNSPSGQSRGQWFMNPGPPSSGMGRGSGQGRGRGRNNNHVSAEDRPHRFFNKSMVEDPWKFLEPVIWKSQKKQWIPHSKKPRVSESPKQSNSSSSSQPSLAEILAASFNDAANDEPNAG